MPRGSNVDIHNVVARLREAGVSDDVIAKAINVKVKLSRDHVQQIEARLTMDGIVVMRAVKSKPGKWEFISPKFVELTRKRTFEDRTMAQVASELGREAKLKAAESQPAPAAPQA